MSGQLWEVIGGGKDNSVLVRQGESTESKPLSMRLCKGAVIRQKLLLGSRLQFTRLAGVGPESGWVTITLKGVEQVVRSSKRPWDLTDSKPKQVITDSATAEVEDIWPQCPQAQGEPFAYYHQVRYIETKPKGLKMSACLAMGDDATLDMTTMCDPTVESFGAVSLKAVEIGIELLPGMKSFNEKEGLLYAIPDGNGPVLSWARAELQCGWPAQELALVQEQWTYSVGKMRESDKRTPLARTRMKLAMVNDEGDTLQGDQWQKDAAQFWAKIKGEHSSENLNSAKLMGLYNSSGSVFKPTMYMDVTIKLSRIHGDITGLRHHGKIPELLYDVNMLAGPAFQNLVQEEADPQSFAAKLSGKMEVGMKYSVMCFLELSSNTAVYVFLPLRDRPSFLDDASDSASCPLTVCACYSWQTDNGETLSSEHFQLCDLPSQESFIRFAKDKSKAQGEVLDLSLL